MSAYKQGFIDGLHAYAWWKDGTQQVGTTGKMLRDAVASVEKTWNYTPPSDEPMRAALQMLVDWNADKNGDGIGLEACCKAAEEALK